MIAPLTQAAQAAQAYRSAAGSLPDVQSASASAATAAPAPGSAAPDFGDAIGAALRGTLDQAQAAEQQARAGISGQGISGPGDLTSIVTAISRAELALQTTAAIRDRVLQAYQDIIRMPI